MLNRLLQIIENPSMPIILAITAASLVFLFNKPVAGPMIQPDEGSYLANAAAIAGFKNDMANSYAAGYSLVLSPAFVAGSNPDAIWQNVKLINAGIYLMLFLGLWCLSGHIAKEGARQRERIVAVILVAAYPMWATIAGYCFAQLLFAAILTWMSVFLYQTIQRNSKIYSAAFGICCGYLYWTHPVGMIVVIVLMVTASTVACTQRQYGTSVVMVFCTVLMILLYRYGFMPWLHDRMTIAGPPALHYPGLRHLLAPLATSSGWIEFVARISGQIFYFAIGSAGFVVSGCISLSVILAGLCNRKMKCITATAAVPIAVFLLLSFAGVICIGALLFTSGTNATRLDHWMYGRYAEGIIPPLLLFGALRARWRCLLWSIPVAIVSIVILSIGLDDYSHTARFNVSAFWQDFFIRDKGIWMWLISGCAVILFINLCGRKYGTLATIAFFFFCSYLQISWHIRAARNETVRCDAARYIRGCFPAGIVVGFDHAGINSYNRKVFWHDFGFPLYDYQLQRMSLEAWTNGGSAILFSYDKDINEVSKQARIIALSPKSGPALWIKGEVE